MARLTLHERLDLGAATPLYQALAPLEGEDLEVDASQVAHLGTLCLQVLLSVAQATRQSGHSFRLSDPSPAFLEHLAQFGLDAEVFAGGGP